MPATYPEYWPQFFTATILEWKPLLAQDRYKDKIIKSLQFLVKEKRIRLNAFVIMINHIHLIWQALPGQTPEKIQHSLLKYTAQEIKLDLQRYNAELLFQFKVIAKDRDYQFWERNSLSIELRSAKVFIQKLEHQSGKLADWVRDLLCRKSNFVVTCALANKLARIAWALTARQQTYVA